MSIHGSLSTMSVTDLMQWAAACRKTGVLKVEKDGVCKRIHFREGRLIGCASNDPPTLLGQIMLSRGKITEAQLQQALARQEAAGGNIAAILVEMGAVSSDEVTGYVATKAEETIYGVFDWDEAVFRFDEGSEEEPHLVEVDLDVQEVLLKGLERHDKTMKYREVFHDKGLVLAWTGTPPPAGVLDSRMGRQIYESIDGRRTLAEIVLHSRASEYLVITLLYELQRRGVIKVTDAHHVQREAQVESEVDAALSSAAAADGSGGSVALAGDAGDSSSDLTSNVEAALRFMGSDEPQAALDILHDSYRGNEGDATLRKLIAKAETAVEDSHKHDLPHDKVPVLVKKLDTDSLRKLSPEASYLPSLIDGQNDMKSILWLAPMRAVDVLRLVKHMLDNGIIELRDPA